MMSEKLTTKTNVPLRAQHVNATRRSVLEGLSRLLGTTNFDDVSFAGVADEAQVSVRTVYRHFPSREALFQAHWEHINEECGSGRSADSSDELRDLVPQLFGCYEKYSTSILSYFAPRHDRELRRKNLPRIKKGLSKIIEDSQPKADKRKARWAASAISTLTCLRGWVSFKEDFDMDPVEAAEAATWATDVILAELKRGNGTMH
jgi:AcrR family transcriptional regulator